MTTYLLTSEEEQNVTLFSLTHVDLQHCADGSLQVVTLRLWGVKYFHRVGPTRYTHQRCIVEVLLLLTKSFLVHPQIHNQHYHKETQIMFINFIYITANTHNKKARKYETFN